MLIQYFAFLLRRKFQTIEQSLLADALKCFGLFFVFLSIAGGAALLFHNVELPSVKRSHLKKILHFFLFFLLVFISFIVIYFWIKSKFLFVNKIHNLMVSLKRTGRVRKHYRKIQTGRRSSEKFEKKWNDIQA